MKNKKLYLLVGASGTGKTTLHYYMINELGFGNISSITTRPMRTGESQGEPWYFVTEQEFNNIEKVQESTYSGFRYGISKKEIDNKFQKFDNLVFVCNKEAIMQMKAMNLFDIVIINIVVPKEETITRMKKRGDSEENIQKRCEYDRTAFEGVKEMANYIVENIDLEETKKQIKKIIDEEENKNEGENT